MARTIKQIQDAIIAVVITEFAAVGITVDPTLWSKYNIRRLWTLVVATSQWTLEVLFDELKVYIRELLAAEKPHTLKWYATKAKSFQHGYNLVPDEDYYDNTGLTEAQIVASQVIKFCAAVEVIKGVMLKTATVDNNGDLVPVSTLQHNAFKAFMEEVKDAGVHLFYTNTDPDSLKLSLQIYYNALILGPDGKRLDGTNDTPVPDAINDFLKNGIIFNGKFITSKMVDALQVVDGVEIPHIVSIQAQYGALPYTDIPVEYQPDSGYLRIINPADLEIEYIPHEDI